MKLLRDSDSFLPSELNGLLLMSVSASKRFVFQSGIINC